MLSQSGRAIYFIDHLRQPAIANAGRGLDQHGGEADRHRRLLPQAGDEDPQIVPVLDVAGAPDILEELALRHHAPGVGREQREQTVLDRRQMNCLACARDGTADEVDGDLADRAPLKPLASAERCAAARRECGPAVPVRRRAWSDSRRRRHPEPPHLVGIVGARRQHQLGEVDQVRSSRISSTIAVRQTEIEDQ